MSSATELLNDLIFELETSLLAGQTSAKASSAKTRDDHPKDSKGKDNAKDSKPKNSGKAEEKSPLSVNSLDLRVGVIRNCVKHETAEKLYCEEIDVGESEPRKIASGLVAHYSLEEMIGRRLIVVCNLKPRNLVGFKSFGMVLCAVSADDGSGSSKVEFIDPPLDAAIGDRITGEGLIGEPLTSSQV